MLIIPAIDIKDGKCVRLYQGDYNQVTVFDNHPADVARRFQAAGARYLHLVDLDGASEGHPVNRQAIADVLSEITIPVELGGGIRTLKDIEEMLGLGIERVILGTAAIESRELVANAAERFGQRLIVGIDARDGFVATRGWKVTTPQRSVELASDMVSLGVRSFIYTDIHRDGTLSEPGYDTTLELITSVSVPVIASGGVSTIDHLLNLRSIGCAGAIVGRALYTGMLSLEEALATLSESEGDS